MKNSYRRPLAGLALALLTSTAACSSGSGGEGTLTDLGQQLPEEIRDKGVLTLATDAQYPPCEFMQGGEMVGFEPDLWNAMADKLGIKLDVVNTAFDGLIPGVVSGRYDLAMECIDDTLEREEVVSFVNYAYSTDGFLVPERNAGEITSDSLSVCGKTASVPRGTIWVTILRDELSRNCTKNGKPEITIKEFPSSNAALLAVYSGRADFQVVNLASGTYIAENAPEPVTAIPYDKSHKIYSGIVLAKENTELQEALLAALRAIIEDGQYQAIMKKWNLEDIMLKKPGINLTSQRPPSTE